MMPLMAKAVEMTVLAGTPSMRVMREVVGGSTQGDTQHGAPQQQGQQRQHHDAGQDGQDIAPGHAGTGDHDAGLEDLRQGHGPLARGEMINRAPFCSRVLTAKEVISMAVNDFSRTGRKATNSVNRLVNMATTTARTATTNQGSGVKTGQQIHGVAADHDQFAIGEVDQAQDAINDHQTQGQHGI